MGIAVLLPPSFDPGQLVTRLPQLHSPGAQEDCAEKTAYLQFYRLPDQHEYPGLSHRMGSLESGGHQVCVQVFEPEQARATLYLLHGYYDHVGLYGHLIRWALDHGYAVVSFDLPGHGLSSGARAVIGSFLEYVEVFDAVLQATQQELPSHRHVMGQSTGGAIIMEYLLASGFNRENSPFDGIVLLAPLVRPAAWRYGRFAYLALRPFLRKIKRSFAENSHDEAFLTFLREQDPLQPRILPLAWLGAMDAWIGRMLEHTPSTLSPLVIQGTHDGTVDWRYNLNVIRNKFYQPRVFYVANAGHHLANEIAELRTLYLDWLDGQLAQR